MELKMNQLMQIKKPKENSYAVSSNDLRELPTHLASTPKSNSISPQVLEQRTKHAEVDAHMEELHETKLESQSHLAHQDQQSRKPKEDYYMEKLFMKDSPPTSSWMTFSGEGESDHVEFIDWVDRLKTDVYMKDALVTSKFNIVLTGLARIWFIELRREGPLTW